MLNLSVDDVNLALRTLIRETLEMPENSVRPADQYAPTGTQSEQFATVKIIATTGPMWANNTIKNEPAPSLNVEETLEYPNEVTVSVNFFRGDAYTKACRLGVLMQSSAAIERMMILGIGFINASNARNLSGAALESHLYEQRGQIDLRFAIESSEKLSVATYGKFPMGIRADVGANTINTDGEVIQP